MGSRAKLGTKGRGKTESNYSVSFRTGCECIKEDANNYRSECEWSVLVQPESE